MRKLIVFCHLSLDGIAAIDSGKLDWITYDNELEKWAEPIGADTDTAVYGRNTFEIMKYWKTVPSDPQASKHELDHAKWIENVEKVVFSKSLTDPDWNNTKVISNNINEEMLKLKQKPGKNITIFGSPTLVDSLMDSGLIDEFQISVNPVLLGTGKSIFKNINERIKLKLIEEQTFKSGVITLHYGRG